MNKDIYIVYYYDQGDEQYLHGVYGNEASAAAAAILIDKDTAYYAIVKRVVLLSDIRTDILPFTEGVYEKKERKTETNV